MGKLKSGPFFFFFFSYSNLAIINNFACCPWETQSLLENSSYNVVFQIVLLKVRDDLCIVFTKAISINLVARESWHFIQTVTTCFIRRFSPGTWRQHNYRTSRPPDWRSVCLLFSHWLLTSRAVSAAPAGTPGCACASPLGVVNVAELSGRNSGNKIFLRSK